MSVIFRNVQGTPLTYNQGDGNFAFLLTNTSGSNVNITGSTVVTGSLAVSGSLILPSVLAGGGSETKVLLVNSANNVIYRTDLSLQGPTGAQGTTGIQGSTGIQGIQGSQGPIGDTGIQGPLGTQGTTGAQGVVGAQGTTGTQGVVGIQGTRFSCTEPPTISCQF